jgi:poly(A) polymerase
MWSSQSQQMPQQKTLGMTSAISQAFPKAIDLQRTKELEEALKPHDVFESEEELNHR